MRILFATAPGYGLTLPVIPLTWAARAEGHEVLLATTSAMVDVGARAGLAVHDVFPERDVWADVMTMVGSSGDPGGEMPGIYRLAAQDPGPFSLFTATMTEGTVAAGRAFGADLVVTTSDHGAGTLTAAALDVPVLEVGNRISWSTRDRRDELDRFTGGPVVEHVRASLGIDGTPVPVARIDVRAPSMGGMAPDAEQADPRDGAPWWPMRFVPYNGGTVVPDWAARRPERPRIAVTLGTVVPAMSGVSSLVVVLEALGGMDVEVVLAAGDADLGGLGALPANVRSIGYLPLSAFVPSCAAVVHHGGSGTTATPLFYGVPQLVLPSFADNPMSAERVVARGVGLSYDPAGVDAATVRDAVGRLLDEPSFRAAAREVAAEMATQPSPAAVLDRAVARLSGAAPAPR
ncbi:nucleotide disphospho-sugar-binding domain-containing protein [Actinomycetospora sp. CA-084318]|uniref:nucleotide disphospho-sugar-binding domain-containing protein n=1 Tax=Actinomycetospora sp. CA-084318 TaxID=3239892 RepID=UPI003D97563E